MSNFKVIEFPKSNIKNKIEEEKSCKNCDHYSETNLKLSRCMHFPDAVFHSVTTNVCTPENRKLWMKKKSLIKRFLEWLY